MGAEGARARRRGEPSARPTPPEVALFQIYGTLATLLEQAGVQGPPLDLLTAPRERSVLRLSAPGPAVVACGQGCVVTGLTGGTRLRGPCRGHLSSSSPARPLSLVWPEPPCSPRTAGCCRLSSV